MTSHSKDAPIFFDKTLIVGYFRLFSILNKTARNILGMFYIFANLHIK
jgi:hypothetical protein